MFVPAVLACSALTLAGWLTAGSPAGHVFSAALAVLIIACPCALGLATPAALVVASGRGAQLGIFIKGYQALESSRAIDTVVLDKTGTVTTGQMTVTGVLAVPGVGRVDLLRFAGSVEQASEHAVAAAVATLAVRDTVKPSAPAAVARLRGLGLRPVLLTGDNAATARAVAAAGIDDVLAEALPADKARVMSDLQAGDRSAAMVGDGVNDAPALAGAQLGLALGSGTDVAIVAADMILLRDDLQAVPDAIALARATFTTIRRNLAWAFCYNIAAIPLAALGFLNPLLAAATMTLSSVFVVWNSLRLRRFAAHP